MPGPQDQFVGGRLNRGTYPDEYLRANLRPPQGERPAGLEIRPDSRASPASSPALSRGVLPGDIRPSAARGNLTTRSGKLQAPVSLSLVQCRRPAPPRRNDGPVDGRGPGLEFLSIWSNDSGSGFGAHEIALCRAERRAVSRPGMERRRRDFAACGRKHRRLLPDPPPQAAAAVNSRFRGDHPAGILLRRTEASLASFSATASTSRATPLGPRAGKTTIPIPSTADVQVLGSALHNSLLSKDAGRGPVARTARRPVLSYHFFGSHGNHEPLLGIPFPWLTHEKLKSCARRKIDTLAHVGGLHPPGSSCPTRSTRRSSGLFSSIPERKIGRDR
ncbi:MAG: hypothetical protein MZU84_05705 [Sphingobacterium sp.]|nr:hypothetical protein [Sphingobacterium sp.]